jgi:hypothetical protein
MEKSKRFDHILILSGNKFDLCSSMISFFFSLKDQINFHFVCFNNKPVIQQRQKNNKNCTKDCILQKLKGDGWKEHLVGLLWYDDWSLRDLA